MQFANFDVTFRYPKDLDLVSSGEIVSDVTEGDERITRRKTTAPIRLAGLQPRDVRASQDHAREADRGGLRQPDSRARTSAAARRHFRRLLRQSCRRAGQAAHSVDARVPAGAAEASRVPRRDFRRWQAILLPPWNSCRHGSVRRRLPTVTVSPAPGASGQGFPGMIYLSTLSYLGPNDRPDRQVGTSVRRPSSPTSSTHTRWRINGGATW